jgi:hypothetical protein
MPWTLHARIVQNIFAQPTLLIEEQVEGLGKARTLDSLIGPEYGRVICIVAVKRSDVHRRTEDDVGFAPVRFPTRLSGSNEHPVSILDAPVVFLAEFVLVGSLGRVPLLPKSLDEDISLPICLELKEHVPFDGGYDVRHFFLEPSPVFFGKVSGFDLLRERKRGD